MSDASDHILHAHMQTQAVHAGFESTDDIVQPIHVSTTFQRQQHDVLGGYTRTGNPNRSTLEKKLAILEGGAEAVAFSSGMAAINGLFEATLSAGSEVLYPNDCYHGARSLLKNVFQKKGIVAIEVDMDDVKNIEAAITPRTKLIWIETPSNPQLKVADIRAIAELGKRKNILTACDSTFATPVLQRPLELGVDFVMHSSTKFFSGHSDVLGGVLIAREKTDTLAAIRTYQGVAGPVPSPFDCWLLNRSLATLTLRVGAQSSNAMALATYLSKHSKIEKVYYPGLASHPNHAIAKAQMKGGFGAVLSILVKGGRNEALDLCRKLRIVKHATSLGGVETLIEHRRSAEGTMALSPDNLLRISVGIEYGDDLIKDFEYALG